MSRTRSRVYFLLAFIASMAGMGTAWYLEYGVGLKPCALSLSQRFFMLAFSLLCLAAAVQGPGRIGLRRYAAGGVALAIAGAAAASRQLWLQIHGTVAPEACKPGLKYLLQTQPFPDAARMLVWGTPECARVNFKLLGMSVAEWSLLAFCAMAVFAIVQWVLSYRRGN